MRRFLIALGAAALWLAFAAPAQAVGQAGADCSLRGDCYPGDPDYRQAWEHIEANRGQLSYSTPVLWSCGNGRCYTDRKFVFARGGWTIHRFTATDNTDAWLGWVAG
jgi:hypothetical protein